MNERDPGGRRERPYIPTSVDKESWADLAHKVVDNIKNRLPNSERSKERILFALDDLRAEGITEATGFQIAKRDNELRNQGNPWKMMGHGSVYRALDSLVESGELVRMEVAVENPRKGEPVVRYFYRRATDEEKKQHEIHEDWSSQADLVDRSHDEIAIERLRARRRDYILSHVGEYLDEDPLNRHVNITFNTPPWPLNWHDLSMTARMRVLDQDARRTMSGVLQKIEDERKTREGDGTLDANPIEIKTEPQKYAFGMLRLSADSVFLRRLIDENDGTILDISPYDPDKEEEIIRDLMERNAIHGHVQRDIETSLRQDQPTIEIPYYDEQDPGTVEEGEGGIVHHDDGFSEQAPLPARGLGVNDETIRRWHERGLIKAMPQNLSEVKHEPEADEEERRPQIDLAIRGE